MNRSRDGSPTMARGIRIPVDDPDLDELLCGVQGHADWELPQPTTRWRFQEVVEQHNARDRRLYEMADRIRSETAERLRDAIELHTLLTAIQKHFNWALQRRSFRCHSLEGYAKDRAQEDHELYDVAALTRLEACQRSPEPGICLDPESLEAVLVGRKTVTRYPVELNVHGKLLGSHFRVNGGKDGSYALWVLPSDGSSGRLRRIPGQRLKIVSVETQPLGGVDKDREARLEGFKDPIACVQAWWARHEHHLFKWTVWRYEFQPIEV